MRLLRPQFRLVVLMASIAFVAFALASLTHPSESRVSIALTLTIAILLAAAFCARFALTPEGRAWWFGFGLFGWAYFVLAGSGWRDQLPTSTLVGSLVGLLTTHYGPYPTPTGRGPWYTNAIHEANSRFYLGAHKLMELYLTLVIAGAGATLIRAVAARLGERSIASAEPEDPS
jgi:hypothetical protein